MLNELTFTLPWCIVSMKRMEFILNDMLNLGKRYAVLFTCLLNTMLWGMDSMRAWRTLTRSQLGWKSMQLSMESNFWSVRICFQTSFKIVSKYNSDIIFYTLSKRVFCAAPAAFGSKVWLVPSIFCMSPLDHSTLGARHSQWQQFSNWQLPIATVLSETDSTSGNGCWSSCILCKTLSRLVKNTDRHGSVQLAL